MIEILHGARETIVYNESISVKPYYNKEFENYPNHWEPSFEIIMPIKNIYTVFIEEEKLVLSPNDVLIIAPGVLHRIEAPREGTRYITLFDASLFTSISGFESLNTMFCPYALYTAQNCDCLLTLNQFMDDLYLEYRGNDSLKFASIYSDLLSFLITAKKHQVNTMINSTFLSDSKSHKYLNKFLNICKYIEDNCHEEITVYELANMSGFSESHFIRLFKQFTNVTYYNYLNQCRINKSKHLLANDSNLSITEVSLQSGFTSIATFNRLFKKQLNCSPTQYRNMQTK